MTVTAPSMRFSTARSASAVYYAGYDPGSRIASLYLCAEDRPDELELSLSVPSIIGDGNVADLVNVRATTDPNAPLASLLKKREYVLEYEGQDYYVGELAEQEGKNATTAHGASDRYWSRHSLLLLLALAAILIPEQKSELRVVTALPVTLYRTKENRNLVKKDPGGLVSVPIQWSRPRDHCQSRGRSDGRHGRTHPVRRRDGQTGRHRHRRAHHRPGRC